MDNNHEHTPFKVRTFQEVCDDLVKLAIGLPEQVNEAGASASFARADHVHHIPTAQDDLAWQFKVEFEAFIDRGPPDCHCDIKRLVSYGHEEHCPFMTWKARKRMS